jgi:cytochrome oxidase assembly protein ShyY1
MSGREDASVTTPARRLLAAIALVLAALAISALAVTAGRWQWGRHETRSHALAAYTAAAGASPVPLSTLDPGSAAALPAGSEWRLATASGTFVPGSLTVLRNRALEGGRVSEYLAWFLLDDGRTLLVQTGWQPLEGDAAPPALPEGRVDVTIELRNQEPDDGKRGDGATRIVAAQLPEAPGPSLAGYGVLRGACDASCVVQYGHPVPDPELTLGPHLAYTVQWYGLAVLAPAGAVLMLVRAGAETADATTGPKRSGGGPGAGRPGRGPVAGGPGRGRDRGQGREPTDEEVEDAL